MQISDCYSRTREKQTNKPQPSFSKASALSDTWSIAIEKEEKKKKNTAWK